MAAVVRLFDKALAWNPPATNRGRERFENLAEGLQWATPLVCDDLLPYAPGSFDLDARTGLRVPWPVAFVEWRNADDIELGVLAFEVDPDTVPGRDPPEGAAATVVMRLMSARRREQAVLANPLGLDVDVTELGQVLDWRPSLIDERFESSPEFKTIVTDGLGVYDLAAWFLIAASARNITHEQVEPPKGLSRKWRRKTGQPLSRYTRVMLPHAPGDRATGAASGAPVPLELVKGHFKTYDTERPLFGKYTGTWWWTPTIRGDPKAGVRDHDYAFGSEAPPPPDTE